MVRKIGVILVLFSLIVAGLHDKIDFLHVEIIGIFYTICFVAGIIIFCLSNPISNLLNPTKKESAITNKEENKVWMVLLGIFVLLGYALDSTK
jgi:hypothetical protein